MLRSLTPEFLTLACRISFKAVGGRNTLRMEGSAIIVIAACGFEFSRAMADQRNAEIPERKQGVDQPADPGPVGRCPHQVAGLRQEIVAHLDIRQMAEQHAMGMQCAFRVTCRTRGVDDQRGIVGRGVDRRKSGDAAFDDAQNDFVPSGAVPPMT